MFSEIRIYYEGDKALTPGFSEFFIDLRTQSKLHKRTFRLISGGSGPEACSDFEIALQSHKDAWNILLIDSEGPDSGRLSESLCEKRGWDKTHVDSIFWMVQMMEAWFHADKSALKRFYGQNFNEAALKSNPNVEEISKKDLIDGLQKATKHIKTGDYFDRKTSHGPKLLAEIDPGKVRAAAPDCRRLFDAVLAGFG